MHNKLFKIIGGGVVAFVFGIYLLAGVTHINPGEVGILVKNLGSHTGMQHRVLAIGTHWIEPFSYDVVTYDARQRQMEDVKDLAAQTGDGQPVQVNFSVQLGLAPALVPTLHESIGSDYYDRVVHPKIIQIVKNKVPSKKSDEVYTSVGREGIEDAINTEMEKQFARYGIVVQINLKDMPFTNSQYIAILEQKARASQQVEVETRLASAAVQTAIKVANVAEGSKQARIKAAEAEREEQKLQGDGSRLRKEEDAKGILAVAKAEAEGVRLKREALEGAGGERMVSMEWAKYMGPNVKVYGIPTGSPGSTAIMDLNGLLKGAFKGAD